MELLQPLCQEYLQIKPHNQLLKQLQVILLQHCKWENQQIKNLVKKFENKDTSGAVNFGIKCIRCLLACFEKCIRYINRNAFTIVALKGSDFCPAAADAFALIFRNPARFGIVGGKYKIK